MKLIWDITKDGWTSIRHLCLIGDNGLAIWSSKEHLHEVNKELFEEDFKFLVENYGLTEDLKSNIEENVRWGRVT